MFAPIASAVPTLNRLCGTAKGNVPLLRTVVPK